MATVTFTLLHRQPQMHGASRRLQLLIGSTELSGRVILQDLLEHISSVTVLTHDRLFTLDATSFLAALEARHIFLSHVVSFKVEESVILDHYHALVETLDAALQLPRVSIIAPTTFSLFPRGLFASHTELLQIRGIETPLLVPIFRILNAIPSRNASPMVWFYLQSPTSSSDTHLIQALLSTQGNSSTPQWPQHPLPEALHLVISQLLPYSAIGAQAALHLYKILSDDPNLQIIYESESSSSPLPIGTRHPHVWVLQTGSGDTIRITLRQDGAVTVLRNNKLLFTPPPRPVVTTTLRFPSLLNTSTPPDGLPASGHS